MKTILKTVVIALISLSALADYEVVRLSDTTAILVDKISGRTWKVQINKTITGDWGEQKPWEPIPKN